MASAANGFIYVRACVYLINLVMRRAHAMRLLVKRVGVLYKNQCALYALSHTTPHSSIHISLCSLRLQLIKPSLSISITFSFSFSGFGKWNNIVEQKPICRHHIDGCMSVNFTSVAIWPSAYIRYNASLETCTRGWVRKEDAAVH